MIAFSKRTKISTRILFFTALSVFLFWRAQYGYSYSDEPFCITLAQRLYQGDALFRDEWHVCQNFGVVLLPFYAIFHAIVGSTTGILLTFRFLYCLLWLCCMVVLFQTLQRKSIFAAYFTVGYLGLFSPLDYMTLSYTSVGLMSTLMILCLFSAKKNDELNLLWGGICGFFMAILSLCNPYMAIPCILLWLVGFISSFFKSNWLGIGRNFFLGCVIGIGIWLIPYLVLLFSREGLKEILKNIPAIMNDPEHTGSSILSVARTILDCMRTFSLPLYKLIPIAFLVWLTGKFLPEKIANGCRLALWLITCVEFCRLAFGSTVYAASPYFNMQIKDIPLLGLIAFLLLREKPWKLFTIYYGVGMMYTFGTLLSSNTGPIAFYMGIATCGVGGIVFISLLTKEFCNIDWNCQKVKTFAGTVAVIMLAIVASAQIGEELYTRLRRTYWDAPLKELNARIEEGPAKGLITSEDNADAYNEDIRNLKELFAGEASEGKTFLSYTSAPWYYLYADLRYDTFSAWSFGYDDKLSDRLQYYYQLNEKEYPDYIYIRNFDGKLSAKTAELYQVKKTSSGESILLCKGE